MPEQKTSKGSQALLKYFDKGILGFAAIVLGTYVYLGKVNYVPDPVVKGTDTLVKLVNTDMAVVHDNKKPPATVDLADRANRIWPQPITSFMAPDWAASYKTELDPKPIKDVEKAKKERMAKMKWLSPKIDIGKAAIQIENVTIPVTIEGARIPGKKLDPKSKEDIYEERTGEDDIQLYTRNKFVKLILERLAPPKKKDDKTAWEKADEVELTGTEKGHEFVDANIDPKKTYAYRVLAVTADVAEGTGVAEHKTITTAEVKATTLSNWQLKLLRVVPKQDTLEATIEILKYEKDRSAWVLANDVKVYPLATEKFRIGGQYSEDESGKVSWNFKYSGKNMSTNEIVKEVEFNTGYKLKEIKQNAKVDQIVRKHDHGPTKDAKNFTLVEAGKRTIETDVISYIDDEGQPQELRRSGADYVEKCLICEPPKDKPKSDGKKPVMEPPKKKAEAPPPSTQPPPPKATPPAPVTPKKR